MRRNKPMLCIACLTSVLRRKIDVYLSAKGSIIQISVGPQVVTFGVLQDVNFSLVSQPLGQEDNILNLKDRLLHPPLDLNRNGL